MNKYLKLAKSGSNYAVRMNRLSNQIFGNVKRPTNSKSMKVVQLFSEKPLHLRDEIVNYYPRHVETGALMMHLREYGLFRDEHMDFKDEMKRLRALRGKFKKSPPEPFLKKWEEKKRLRAQAEAEEE